MSVAKSIKNDPNAMSPFAASEGIYVIHGAGIEQVGNVLAAALAYDGAGNLSPSGLVAGVSYIWTPGANDLTLINGTNFEKDGILNVPVTLTVAGQFVKGALPVTLTGTPSATVTATLIRADAYFQKLWLYAGKAAVAGILTANGAAINLGKSGMAATQYLPDVLNPGDSPLGYELPVGQKMHLGQILIKGTAGDGVYYQFT